LYFFVLFVLFKPPNPKSTKLYFSAGLCAWCRPYISNGKNTGSGTKPTLSLYLIQLSTYIPYYLHLAPSWCIRSVGSHQIHRMSTYAKSCNRTLNTNRHIESSVGRLFSCDSCILVSHLNFTNKAPPIIKTLTNFGLRHFFAHPLSSSLISSHQDHTSSHIITSPSSSICRP
jgi:hypothetical protein